MWHCFLNIWMMSEIWYTLLGVLFAWNNDHAKTGLFSSIPHLREGTNRCSCTFPSSAFGYTTNQVGIPRLFCAYRHVNRLLARSRTCSNWICLTHCWHIASCLELPSVSTRDWVLHTELLTSSAPWKAVNPCSPQFYPPKSLSIRLPPSFSGRFVNFREQEVPAILLRRMQSIENYFARVENGRAAFDCNNLHESQYLCRSL